MVKPVIRSKAHGIMYLDKLKRVLIKTKHYSIASDDYLKRAKGCLGNKSKEHLFYAAFELRCGVESRLQEYLEAQEEVSKKQKEDWQIDRLGRSVQKALKVTDKIAIMKFYTEDKKHIVTLRYVPVSKRLQDMSKRLGDLLHAQRSFTSLTDAWWKETRSFLMSVSQELEKACSGTILAPPLRSKTGGFNITIVPNNKDLKVKDLKKLDLLKSVGKNCIVDISYQDL